MRTGIPILATALAMTVFMSSLVLESMDTTRTEASIRTSAVTPNAPLTRVKESLGDEGALTPNLDPRIANLLDKAASFREDGNVRGAFELYRAALQIAPDNADILIMLGTCCMELKRPQEAETHFRQAAAAAPDELRPVALKHVAFAQLRQEKLGPALENLKALLAEQPYDPVVHFELGCVHACMMNEERALFHLEMAYARLGGDMFEYMTDPLLDNVRHSSTFKDMLRASRAAHMAARDGKPAAPPAAAQ